MAAWQRQDTDLSPSVGTAGAKLPEVLCMLPYLDACGGSVCCCHPSFPPPDCLAFKKKSIFCVRTSVYVCGAMIVQWKPEISSSIVGPSCHVIIIVLLVCSLF